MKKMRALYAAVLGFSLLLGNIGYAAEVVETVEPSEIILPEEPDSAPTDALPEDTIIEKNLEEQTETIITREAVAADIALLDEMLPAQKEDLSVNIQDNINDIVSLAENNAISAAKSLNQITDDTAYEAALHEVLDSYYAEDANTSEAQIAKFSDTLDSRADAMLADYAEAKAERDNQENLDYQTGKILVSFESGTTKEEIEEIAERMGSSYRLLNTYPIDENLPEDKLKRLEKVRDYKFPDIAYMDIGLDKTVDKAEGILEELSCVSSADANGLLKLGSIATDMDVNDPDVNKQTYLSQIQAPQAWNTWHSSEEHFSQMYVAVLDSGLDITHEDLKNQYLKDKSIVIKQNGANIGIEPMTVTNCCRKDIDDGEHGTKVSGIIAAQSNNSRGIVGLASLTSKSYNFTESIKIMAINVFDSDFYDEYGKKRLTPTSDDVLIEAIRYAVANGADVINMSLGGPGYNAKFQEAINYAHAANVIVCASAGNGKRVGDNNVGQNIPFYPASYNHVISVASVNGNNIHSPFSNYHNTVDIAAPGENIWGCILNSDYYWLREGTSFSCPMVSATAALMRSMGTASGEYLSADEIENILYSTATDLFAPGKDEYSGYGLLNMNLALQTARYRFVKGKAIQNMKASPKDYQSILLSWNHLDWADRYLIYRSTSPNGTYTKIRSLKVNEINAVGYANVYFTDTGLDTGTTYYYKVRAADAYQDSYRFGEYGAVVSAKCTLDTPTGLTLTPTTKKMTLSWKKVNGASGYLISKAASQNGTFTRIKEITNGATLSFADTSVTAGKTYYYRMRAYRTVNGKKVLSNLTSIVSKKAK